MQRYVLSHLSITMVTRRSVPIVSVIANASPAAHSRYISSILPACTPHTWQRRYMNGMSRRRMRGPQQNDTFLLVLFLVFPTILFISYCFTDAQTMGYGTVIGDSRVTTDDYVKK
eukprot:Tbor_TRINITY_DN3411_c0_g3::TRINITY_DN3411_c0_g3_i1::g.3685::m.3685